MKTEFALIVYCVTANISILQVASLIVSDSSETDIVIPILGMRELIFLRSLACLQVSQS